MTVSNNENFCIWLFSGTDFEKLIVSDSRERLTYEQNFHGLFEN